MIPLYIRYCIICGMAYDIDTDKETCPECRRKKLKEDIKDGKQRTL